MGCKHRYSAISCLPRPSGEVKPRGTAIQGLGWIARSLVLVLVVLVHHALADKDVTSTAAHVSTFCELQRALADSDVVHVVVTGHLFYDSAANCSQADDSTDRDSISSAECDRQDRDARDSDDARDNSNDERTPSSCQDEEESTQTVELPLLVHGARKTIRGACEEPPPDTELFPDTYSSHQRSTDTDAVPVTDSSDSPEPSHCLISVPSVLLRIAIEESSSPTASSTPIPNTSEDTGSPVQQQGRRLLEVEASSHASDSAAADSAGSTAAAPLLWMSDILILPQGLLESQWEAAGTSAVLEFEGADVWLTSVSILGDTATCMSCMNRALSVKNSRVYSRGCTFSQLSMGEPSPVLLLDTGTAAFHSCHFSDIRGPHDCAAMHAYAGEILLEQSTFYQPPAMPQEHQICLADGGSRVYGTSVLKTATTPEAASSSSDTSTDNSVPANAVPANAVPANAVPANAVPANAVPANSSSEDEATDTAETLGTSTSEFEVSEVRVVDLESGMSSSPQRLSETEAETESVSPQFLAADEDFMELVRDQAAAADMAAPLHLHTLPSSTVQQPSISDESLSGQAIVLVVVAVVILFLLAVVAALVYQQFKRGRCTGAVASQYKLQETGATLASSTVGLQPGAPGSSATHPPRPCDSGTAIGSSYVAADTQNLRSKLVHPSTFSSLPDQCNRWLRDPKTTQAASTSGDGVGPGPGPEHCFDTFPPSRGAAAEQWQRQVPVQDPRRACLGNGYGLVATNFSNLCFGMSVPSQDSAVHQDLPGTMRPMTGSGNLNATGSGMSQHGASPAAPQLPLPLNTTKEGLARTSVHTSPTTPFSNSISDLFVPGRKGAGGGTVVNDGVQAPGPTVPCIHGMHRPSQSSALLATASTGDIGGIWNTYSSMRSMHAAHAFRSPENRKTARWTSMSQEEITDLTTMLSTRSVKKEIKTSDGLLTSNKRRSSGATRLTPDTPDNAVSQNFNAAASANHADPSSTVMASPAAATAADPAAVEAAAKAQRSQLCIDADLGLSDNIHATSGDSPHHCAEKYPAGAAAVAVDSQLNIDQLLEGWSGEGETTRCVAHVPAGCVGDASVSERGPTGAAVHHIDADCGMGQGCSYVAEGMHAPVHVQHAMHQDDARKSGSEPLESAYAACDDCVGRSTESMFFPLPPQAALHAMEDFCVRSRSSGTAEDFPARSRSATTRLVCHVDSEATDLYCQQGGGIGQHLAEYSELPKLLRERSGCDSNETRCQVDVEGFDAVRVRDRVRAWDSKDAPTRQVLLDRIFGIGFAAPKGSKTQGDVGAETRAGPPESFPVEPGALRWR